MCSLRTVSTAHAILVDWSRFVERYFLLLQSEYHPVYLLRVLYASEAKGLAPTRTLENLFRAHSSACQLDIHCLCNSRPIALGYSCSLTRGQYVRRPALISRWAEAEAVLAVAAVVAGMGAKPIKDCLEARPHNHEGGGNNGDVKFDNNYKVGRDDEPWEGDCQFPPRMDQGARPQIIKGMETYM